MDAAVRIASGIPRLMSRPYVYMLSPLVLIDPDNHCSLDGTEQQNMGTMIMAISHDFMAFRCDAYLWMSD